jgi:hypothetical protein
LNPASQPLTQLLAIQVETVSLPAFGLELRNLQCSLEVTFDKSLYADYLRLLTQLISGDSADHQDTYKLLT